MLQNTKPLQRKNRHLSGKLMLLFIAVYLLIFIIVSAINKNYEFLYHAGIISLLTAVIIFSRKKLHLPSGIIIGLSIVGVLHILGGNLYLKNIRLYDTWLIPGILKYDNIIHLVFIFIATFIAYSLLSPYLYKELIHDRLLLSLLLILVALGVGSLIEIVELLAVVFINASEKVGGYMNNALDIVFNLIGALIACFFLMYHHKKSQEISSGQKK